MKAVNEMVVKTLIAVMWCGMAVGCVADEVKQPAVSEEAVITEPKQQFELTYGSQYALCNDYLALMNRVQRNPKNSCDLEYNFDAEAKAKGFKEINWVEVDTKEHEKMLHSYWVYIKSVGTNFIDGWKEKNMGRIEEEYRNNFLPIKHRLWHATLDLNNDGKAEEVYKLVSGNCTLNNAEFFIASEKGFASTNAGARIDVHGSLIRYQGRAFVVNATWINEPRGGEVFVYSGPTVCDFKPVTNYQGKQP